MTAPLAAVGLTRRLGEQNAVDHLDLEVAAGQVHAVVGLNGAGKTTLLRLLLGLLRPTSGRALLHGVDVRGAPAPLLRRLGHAVDAPFAYPELTVRENVTASARLHDVPRSRLRPAVDEAVERLGLGRWAATRAAQLSTGNRQRCGLAAAVVHRPRVLVLDEPASALDPRGVVLVRGLLRSCADEDGAAVLVSSHHLDEVARVADQISVVHAGRVVGGLPPRGTDLEQRLFALAHAADEQEAP